MWVGLWIAFKFLKDESFLVESDGMLGMYPDPEVMWRCYASRFEGVIWMFIMGAKHGVQMI
ncbi:MAG: hypothetical protein WCQ41_10745 [Bacillota bacterium]